STKDYIQVAEKIAGKDVGAFLKDWLYGTTTPAMPGHPDWKPDSVAVRSQGPAKMLVQQDPAKILAQDPSVKPLLEGHTVG
ncbi:hypothetical protein ACIGW8_36990, partial [Streptomyces sioyaensis]